MKKLNLINKRFGRLIVINCTGVKDHKGNYVWNCLCDCGNLTKVPTFRLRNGCTKSCGCLKRDIISAIGKSNKLPKEQALFNKLYYNYKRNANKRNLEWAISKRYFKKLITARCSYCGDTTLNGVDRIDNSKGYTIDNTQSCCETCNKMKLTMRHDEFLEHINKIWRLVRRDHQ